MLTLVAVANRALTGLFDLLLAPFRLVGPIWALLAVSLGAGALLVWIFGRVSDQAAVAEVRDRIRGHLLGMRIFGDDVRLLFLLLGRVLRSTVTYLRHALVPMVVMLVPVVALLIQLELRFAVRPLVPGERGVLTVRAREGMPLEDLTLRANEGVVVETPGVRSPDLREVAWRIRAERAGRHRLEVDGGGDQVTKLVVVGASWQSVPAVRSGEGVWQALLHPGEPPIPASARIERIELAYPALPLTLLGFGLDWLAVFFVASLVFGFALRKPLGVTL